MQVVEVDIRLLVLLFALASMVQGSLSLLFSSQISATQALRPIGYSTIMMAASLVAMVSQDVIRGPLPTIVAHTLAGIAMLLIERGVRVFQREKTRDPFGWIVVAALATLLAVNSVLGDELRPRLVVISLAGTVLLTRIALRLRNGVRGAITPAYRATENIFWIFGAVMGLRLVLLLGLPSPLSTIPLEVIQLATLPVAILLLTAATLGFWTMEVQRLHGELLKLASTDELTGTLNRRAFLAECERQLSLRGASAEPVSLVLFDLDHFKRVNDTFGHPVGDEVLRHCVRVLKSTMRPDDALGRFGGEEFAVLLRATSVERALEIAERARINLAANPVSVGELRIPVTCSVGVATFPLHGETGETLISAADSALYAAKAGGRNCTRIAELPV